jgi:uncharacterized protein
MRRAAAPLLALLACVAVAFAARAGEPAIPAPSGYVNDRAGAMGGWAARTEALCREIERATGAQVAVLTVKSTEGMAPQQYAQRVFDRWKIGKKGKDDGVLVLLAVDDRKLWIATGYGVEGVLPDGKVGEIRDRYMVPAFRQGRYGEGIHDGVAAIGAVLRGGKAPPPKGAAGRKGPRVPFWLFLLLAPIVVILLFRALAGGMIAGPGRRGGPYYTGGFGGGGFGGGGFGGLGGGSSGGGGAGGGW